MSLEEVARHIQKQLGTQNVVVVGEPGLRVKTIGDCAHVLSSVLPALRACDVALVGETPQHDTFEYLRDAMTLGIKKARHDLPRRAGGMGHGGLRRRGCRPLVPELSVAWISSYDPFHVPPIRRA